MKKNKKIISILSIAFLIFAGIKFYNDSNINSDNKIPPDNNPNSSLQIGKIESNLKIKYLQTSKDSQGHEVISFNYEILPVEANDKTVTTSLNWTDSLINDEINEYLSYTHDQDNFKVSITCLQKANNQAKFHLVSNANNNATASILIDFEQEFLGFSSTSIELNKELSLSDGETIFKSDDIQNQILELSNGFLGTISINNKEISNYKEELMSTSLLLDNNNIPLIENNSDLLNAYSEARKSNISNNFVSSIGTNYIQALSNSLKETIRTSSTLTLSAQYSLSFDYYGQSFNFICNLNDTFSTSILENNTYVNVEEIVVDGNIIFK